MPVGELRASQGLRSSLGPGPFSFAHFVGLDSTFNGGVEFA
jgi:hypothetical protein